MSIPSSSSSDSLSSLLSSLPLPLSSVARRARCGAAPSARGCRGPPARAFLPKPSAFSRATSASFVGSSSPASARFATSFATSASSSGRSSSSLPERLT
eukprot:4508515-Prymnesium_polylepis.1